jgi:predicted GIY-YIG superfamily endonuclease
LRSIPSPLPVGHGIYLLKHEPTKSLYVGSSTNLRDRLYQWRRDIKRGYPGFPTGPMNDWLFQLVERTEGMTYQELRSKEYCMIDKIKKAGLPVLNRQAPQVITRIDMDGLQGSVIFHATRLGKSPKGVYEKLKKGYSVEEALGLTPRTPSDYDHRQAALDTMRIQITHEGNRLTYGEAAALLGCRPETLKERVWRRNLKGGVELEALR